MSTSDPSKKLMGKIVTVIEFNEEGVIRGYDPASKKWWVTNLSKLPGLTTSLGAAWFAEGELTVK